MDAVKIPFFELPDEGGDVFRSEEMLGLKWILAYVSGDRPDILQILESRHAKAMMMNAPIIVISDLPCDAMVSLRKTLGSRMKMLSDDVGEVLSSLQKDIADFSLIVLDRDHRVVSIYRELDIQALDRALRKASRI